ncbi:MAG: exodeoxyribonuclease VII large subunit, partial [Gordonia sp. (in: high G+C Gram-positive bacteria)]|uniref:exodeoxyribonuclease VII large subunit n=1 Tax=Gordonia sp. (in: high G+C Gram-positive bacteria) TaxID=84139 RepID=UPI003BB49761
TPTDAAKQVAPDVAAERAMLETQRTRSAHALRNWVAREERIVDGLRARPVLARPQQLIETQREAVRRLRTDLRRSQTHHVTVERHHLTQLSARLATLGPAQTLARGYAVVQRIDEPDGPHAVSSTDQLPPGARVRIRVSDGAVHAAVTEEGDQS